MNDLRKEKTSLSIESFLQVFICKAEFSIRTGQTHAEATKEPSDCIHRGTWVPGIGKYIKKSI